MGYHEEDRAFLHELSAPLAVAKTLIQIHLSELEGKRAAAPLEKQSLRMKKIIEEIGKIENLHATQKERITIRKY